MLFEVRSSNLRKTKIQYSAFLFLNSPHCAGRSWYLPLSPPQPPPHPRATPGPLGRRGVGPKHKTFCILSTLSGCLVPWFTGPADTHGSHQCWAVLWVLWRTSHTGLEKKIYNCSSTIKNWKPTSGRVWLWGNNNTGSRFGSENQTRFQVTWSEVDG